MNTVARQSEAMQEDIGDDEMTSTFDSFDPCSAPVSWVDKPEKKCQYIFLFILYIIELPS